MTSLLFFLKMARFQPPTYVRTPIACAWTSKGICRGGWPSSFLQLPTGAHSLCRPAGGAVGLDVFPQQARAPGSSPSAGRALSRRNGNVMSDDKNNNYINVFSPGVGDVFSERECRPLSYKINEWILEKGGRY